MKSSIIKTKDELPMFLTVMDMAVQTQKCPSRSHPSKFVSLKAKKSQIG